ncbi:MAG: PAS domain-containing protein [Thermodesulfobacteriota bacterium]
MDKATAELSRPYQKERYEQLFHMLLEAIPSSVLLIDRDMRIVLANRNFLEKSRKDKTEAIGHRLEELLPATIVENMDIVSRVRHVFEEKQATKGERMTYRAPGVPMRIYYYSILPFSWESHIEHVMLLMEDVTEQVRLNGEVRRVERHLASVVECATDMVLSTDAEGRIVTWNSAAEQVSGRRFEEVKGTPLLDWFVEDHAQALAAVSERLKVGTSPQTGEWDIVTKAGKRIPMSWVFSPMQDEKGQLVGIVAVGRDLSERRKLEAQLLQSQKLAALGVMAGGIAHEIRNPLGVCLVAAELLTLASTPPDVRRECVEKIRANIQKASAIIENLLSVARPAATTHMTHVDLVCVLHDTLSLVANQARLQNVSVGIDNPTHPVIIYGNVGLLQQVFLNLFLNAINAMPHGGDLHLFVEQTAWEVSIRISDSGHGIPQEHLANIFDPFYTLSPVGKGTGLGLSICYSIIKHHFGSIEIRSAEKEGTVVTVTLPLFLDSPGGFQWTMGPH